MGVQGHFRYWGEALRRGLPSLLWVAGFLTLFLGGSIAVALVFGAKHLVWGAIVLFAAIAFVMGEGAAKIGQERDRANAELERVNAELGSALEELARRKPSSIFGDSQWTNVSIENVGSLVGGPGIVPYLPGDAESEQPAIDAPNEEPTEPSDHEPS
jgi:hypothetical protein